MASTATKKRKRDDLYESDISGEQATLQLYEEKESAVGPILASFPAITPSKSIAFKCYAQGKAKSDVEFSSRKLVVAGESDTVEIFSTNESEEAAVGCRYYVGVRNKRTNVVTIRPAPIQVFTRNVKALKNLTPIASSSAERIAARNALGETFGTKKAQKAIRAAERNKVDVSAMQGVTSHIQESIEAKTQSLPTQEKAKELEDESRNIPPFNAEAKTPSEVYELHKIIPQAEFNAIDINEILQASSDYERMSSVPSRRSDWVRHHVSSICNSSKPDKKALKIVLYVSAMMAFYVSAHKLCNDRDALQQRLSGVPSNVIDGLLERFTDNLRGSSERRFSTENQIMLLTHMFALCLRVDNYVTDTTVLANDLKETIIRINQYFKLLGCKIEKLSAPELARLELQGSTEVKRAVLKVPLEFPKARIRRKN
ncbi:Rpa49 subunit specific to nuclear RNA polymerase I [Schizopora paradoxa]|uniref:Rpa49 subunit specific to nuclear RNA polymerase I n=1 Tax=Schizopora paradoxa TaxID=27342 RepID=A0A0H2S461_9AGAM|nr:Rpa49 subunit specific to nuclear RNA polymerase I [Schizopora paradoxa]